MSYYSKFRTAYNILQNTSYKPKYQRSAVMGKTKMRLPATLLKKVPRVIKKVVRPKVGRVNPRLRKVRSNRGDGSGVDITFGHGKPVRLYPAKVRTKMIKSLAAPNRYDDIGSATMTGSIGQCQYYTPQLLTDNSHLQVINDFINGGPTGPNTIYDVDGASIDYTLTNYSQASAYLRIYDCVLRRDLPSSFNSLQSFVDKGWNDTITSGSSVTFKYNTSDTIFQNNLFVQYVKVLGVRNVMFTPGQSKDFKLVDNRSWRVNTSIIDASNTIGLAHRTRFLLFQLQGQTVRDSTTPSLVSTDLTNFLITWKSRYRYTWMNDLSLTVNTTGNYGNVLVPQYIDEMTGAVVSSGP